MNKNMIIAIIFLSLFSVAGAKILPDNCSEFTGIKFGDCTAILSDGSIPTSEKEYLYLNLLEDQGVLGSYDFVWNWNEKLAWNSIPEGTETKGNGIIRGAWVKLVSLHKSYFDEEKSEWFPQPSGKALIEHGYRMELPAEKEPGDCETHYSSTITTEQTSLAVNGIEQGSGRIVNFETSVSNNSRMDFEASLNLTAQLRVDHYRLRERCEWTDSIPREYVCYNVCEYSHTDYREYSVNPKDTFVAKAKNYEPMFTGFLEENSGFNKIKAVVSAQEPINELDIMQGDKKYSYREAFFDLGVGKNDTVFVAKNHSENKAGNGFLQLDYNRTTEQFLVELGTTDNLDCTYSLYSDFLEKHGKCNLKKLEETELSISPDVNSADFGENVQATVSLKDSEGNPLAGKKISLQGKELATGEEGTTVASVKASGTNGVITASFLGDDDYKASEATARIPLERKQSGEDAGSVGVFFTAYYLVFLFAKKVFTGGI